nr:MAG TPA: hypothetical protein [Caudoviricetes sp.]
MTFIKVQTILFIMLTKLKVSLDALYFVPLRTTSIPALVVEPSSF